MPLPPISPIMPEVECDHLRGIKEIYARTTKQVFPGEAIALTVVRANLKNRLEHAKRNHYESFNAFIAEPYADVNLVLAHHALSLPEDRAKAFVKAKRMPAVEAHAELLDNNTELANDFSEGVLAVAALANDMDGEVTSTDVRSRAKVTRLVQLGDEEFAVVRSKIDGLTATIDRDQIELKMRRSGAVALSAVQDEDVRRAFKILGSMHNLPDDDGFIEPQREIVEDYINQPDAAYKGYVQSYYLTRTTN